MDARSDIFSFGAVLYEMVSGRRPFGSDPPVPVSALAAIVNQEPRPLDARAPYDLRKLIERCLRKDPERRYQSIKDVKIALEDLKEDSESGKVDLGLQPVPRARDRVWRRLAGLVLLAGGVLVAVALLTTAREAPPAVTSVPLTTFPGLERWPAFSPDGHQVAFVWDGPAQDNQDVYIQLIGSGGRPLRLTTDPARDFSPAWSPDGRSIAFLRRLAGPDAAVMLIPALGGPERRLTEVRAPEWWMAGPHIAWTPDGRGLAIVDQPDRSRPHGITLLSVESGERRSLTSPPTSAFGDSDSAFSPDGRRLAFTRAADVSDVYVVALDDTLAPVGEPRLTSGAWWAGSPTWVKRENARTVPRHRRPRRRRHG